MIVFRFILDLASFHENREVPAAVSPALAVGFEVSIPPRVWSVACSQGLIPHSITSTSSSSLFIIILIIHHHHHPPPPPHYLNLHLHVHLHLCPVGQGHVQACTPMANPSYGAGANVRTSELLFSCGALYKLKP